MLERSFTAGNRMLKPAANTSTVATVATSLICSKLFFDNLLASNIAFQNGRRVQKSSNC